MLNYGDFDERIFLCNETREELGTSDSVEDDLAEQITKQTKKHIEETKSLAPVTPLSNRQYLQNRTFIPSTPVSNATQTVSRLHSLLLNRSDGPSETLEKLFGECSTNPREAILKRVKEMGEKFCNAYCQPNDDMLPPSPQSNEFAKKRLTLGITFYYKVLESIMLREKKRMPAEKLAEGLAVLLSHEMFHLSLFACSMEIILFSYNAKKIFPWILEVFNEGELRLQPFYFYKVVEPIIREEEGLSRDVVKHLNSIEEKILENLAWKSDSPLWEAIRNNNNTVPSSVEVLLPTQNGEGFPLASPARRNEQSPVSNSAAERFGSPLNRSTRRRLFSNIGGEGAETPNITQQGQIVLAIPSKCIFFSLSYKI